MEFSNMNFTEPDLSHSYSGLYRDTVLRLAYSVNKMSYDGEYELTTETYELRDDDSKFIDVHIAENSDGFAEIEVCGSIVTEKEVAEVYQRSAMNVSSDDFDDVRGKMLADAYGYMAMFIW